MFMGHVARDRVAVPQLIDDPESRLDLGSDHRIPFQLQA